MKLQHMYLLIIAIAFSLNVKAQNELDTAINHYKTKDELSAANTVNNKIADKATMA